MSNLTIVSEEMVSALDTATENGLIAQSQASAFQRTFAIAESVQHLQQILTDQNMAPIMNLQGLKIGFKTDKVYPVATVRNCLIEAVMTGVYPTGNQFNIIAGNCYITKEGTGYLLSQIKGLGYSITPTVPKTNTKVESIIKMIIEWNYKGKTDKREIDFCIKVNSYMTSDAIIGKATRKARAWLLMHVTGQDIGEGDADEIRQEKNITPQASSGQSALDALNVKATVINEQSQQITVAQLINTVGASEADMTMYFKTLQGVWGIVDNLSELGQEQMQAVINKPADVKKKIDEMLNEA